MDGRRAPAVADGGLSLEPQVLAGAVAFAEDTGGGAAPIRSHAFEGKLSVGARWDFSPQASLLLSAAVQLDEAAFGGGGAQLRIVF